MTAKTNSPRKNATILLAAAVAAALFAATPAFAQDAPDAPETVENDAGVPKDRLVDEYAAPLFDGDEVAAGEAITALRSGGDFTVTTTETRQVTNADGSLATNPDGTPKMETVTIETTIENPNGPMGWGEVDHSLGIAQALVENGNAGSFEEALMGTATTETVTNADGTTTTTTTYEGGILQMRADGMGWGQIAKELGFKSLGEIKSGRAFASEDTDGEAGTATASAASEKSAKGRETAANARDKTDRNDRADGTGKPDKLDRVAKVDRPEKIERPQRPDRPERPVKPERPSRP